MLVSSIALFFLLAVYISTAPLLLPTVYDTTAGRTLYKPVLWAIQKEWAGRKAVLWYCYEVCKMDLLLPLETTASQN